MKKKSLALLLALIMVVGCLAGCGDSGSEAVAKVGDTELTMAELETYAEITAMMYYGMDYSTMEDDYKAYMQQMMLSGLADAKIAQLYCEENKIDITKQENYQENLDSFLESVSTEDTYKTIVKNCGLTEDDLKAYYDGVCSGNVIYEEVEAGIKDLDAQISAYYEEHKVDLYTTAETEITASHILVADEATGKEVLEKLNAGGDFAELAKEYSTDGSASNGGVLGTYTESNCNWVEEFKAAAFKLKAGETSGLVKTEYGYHIIRVTERAEAGTVKSLDSVKDDIKQELIYQAYSTRLSELQKKYGVEYLLKTESDETGAEGETTEDTGDGAAEGATDETAGE